MLEADYPKFVELLDQTCAILSKGTHVPSPKVSAMWFRVLAQYDLETVRGAFDAHVRDPDRGRFVPVPADIIGKIRGSDGRPSSDEAWAIAVKGSDEQASVTWTDEIAEAWGIARPIWAIGDDVGARMAFRHAYDRIVAEAQKTGKRANWWPSLGHDPAAREPEVTRAANAGLLEHEAALMLQAPDDQTLAKLTRNAPAHAREALLRLRDRLIAQQKGEVYEPNPDIARTAELKQKAQDLTDEYMREHG